MSFNSLLFFSFLFSVREMTMSSTHLKSLHICPRMISIAITFHIRYIDYRNNPRLRDNFQMSNKLAQREC